MKIALDATPLSGPGGGIRRYTGELSTALACEFPQDEFVLLSDQPYDLPDGAPGNLTQGPSPSTWLDRRWWLWGLNRAITRAGCDAFHGTDFAAPYLPQVPAVVTIHDLSPWMDPAWHSGAVRVRRRTPLIFAMNAASLVITGAERIRRQVIERFRLHPSRVFVIPLAAAPHFRPIAAPAPDRPYFLFAGTIEPRKNVSVLVEAWNLVRRRHEVDLVLAGRKRNDAPPIPVSAGIRWLGEVSETDLVRLYCGTAAVLYPSWYEGFGLPVLEAMQCGAPVLASTDGTLTEVSGGAAVHLNPSDPKEWAQAMEGVLANPDWRGRLREKSLSRAAAFSWASTARMTREVYEEAIRRFA